MKPEKTIAEELFFEGKIFTAARKTVELPDGSEAFREIVYHPGGACVVALNEKNETYLVRQYRIAVDDFLYELPAGKLEPGENPKDCARRELLEECGWVANELNWLATIHPTPGYCSEPIQIFWTRNITVSEQKLDEGEYLDTVLLPFEDAVEMALAGKITDSKTLVGLFKAKLRMAEEE